MVSRDPKFIEKLDDIVGLFKPFVWTAKGHDILAKVIRANRRLSSKQNQALH